MSLSARSTEADRRDIVCIICIGVDRSPAPIAAGSWCKKWNKKRKAALTFSDATIATLDRNQREAFKSIKRDIRRCPK